MFERLERMPDDPILGLMAAYRADPDTRKVDLGVGVYRDDKGETPILEAVRKAEAAVLARQTSKTYVAPAGTTTTDSPREARGRSLPQRRQKAVANDAGPGRR